MYTEMEIDTEQKWYEKLFTAYNLNTFTASAVQKRLIIRQGCKKREHRIQCKRRRNDGLNRTKTVNVDMGDCSLNNNYTAIVYTAIIHAYTAVA